MSSGGAWATQSLLDSGRFGLRVFRSALGFSAEQDLNPASFLESEGVDVLILRVRSGDAASAAAFRCAGYEVIYAESLVYYDIELIRSDGPTSCEGVSLGGVSIEQPNAASTSEAAGIAFRSFGQYSSHYAASPELFDKDLVARGYADWAASHLASLSEERLGFVANRDGRTVGFLTFALAASTAKAEVLLNAVETSERRQGVYTALLQATMHAARSKGADHLTISTQLANIPVQRAWSKLGLRIDRAYDTYHVRRQITHPQGGGR